MDNTNMNKTPEMVKLDAIIALKMEQIKKYEIVPHALIEAMLYNVALQVLAMVLDSTGDIAEDDRL